LITARDSKFTNFVEVRPLAARRRRECASPAVFGAAHHRCVRWLRVCAREHCSAPARSPSRPASRSAHARSSGRTRSSTGGTRGSSSPSAWTSTITSCRTWRASTCSWRCSTATLATSASWTSSSTSTRCAPRAALLGAAGSDRPGRSRVCGVLALPPSPLTPAGLRHPGRVHRLGGAAGDLAARHAGPPEGAGKDDDVIAAPRRFAAPGAPAGARRRAVRQFVGNGVVLYRRGGLCSEALERNGQRAWRPVGALSNERSGGRLPACVDASAA
jgi:hypothetical protein